MENLSTKKKSLSKQIVSALQNNDNNVEQTTPKA